jgi:membrane associated rhomboid family serine protease
MFPIRDTKTSKKFPFVNLCLIGINIYFFIQELLAPNINSFIAHYGLIPANINFTNTQTLTPFVTGLFIHAGFLHILSNMWFLWIFGDNVEAAIGHIKYLGFYLFCGIAASFAQYIFMPGATLPLIGASGAIAGVLGAYLRYFPKNKIDTLVPVFGLPIIIAVPASFMLIYWFIIQAFSGVAGVTTAAIALGGVAYIAHIGGFLSGFLLSPFFVW